MRDPRFEPAQLEIPAGCTAGLASKLLVHLLPTSERTQQSLRLDISRLDRPSARPATDGRVHREVPRGGSGTTEVTLPPLDAGAYVARLQVGSGGATRFDFACEAGGDKWGDSRPDPDRMRDLARATGGTFAWADEDLGRIRFPKPTTVSAERQVAPVAPPWVWTLVATVLLGLHWLARRHAGLS